MLQDAAERAPTKRKAINDESAAKILIHHAWVVYRARNNVL